MPGRVWRLGDAGLELDGVAEGFRASYQASLEGGAVVVVEVPGARFW